MAGILLLNPPFNDPSGPHISVAHLLAWLKSRGLPAVGFDLNREFFKNFLSNGRILHGKKYVEDTFRELNAASELNFSQMTQYANCWGMLRGMSRFLVELGAMYAGVADWRFLQGTRLRYLSLPLASAPLHPRGFYLAPYFAVTSPYCDASSSDMLAAAADDGPFDEVLRPIVHQVMKQHRPRLVGLSVVYRQQMEGAFKCARFIKEMDPGVHLVLGGPYISIHMRDLPSTALFKDVDSMVLDEGEIPLVRLWEEISGPSPDLSQVPGLIYAQAGRVRQNPLPPPVDCSLLPAPAYADLDLDTYLNSRNELTLTMRLSKGCTWGHCSFCRTKMHFVQDCQRPSDELAYEQIKEVVQSTGVRNLNFSDDAAHPGFMEYLSRRALKEGLDIKWLAHTRVSPELTAERARLYKQAGCQKLAVGVEAFSGRLLKLMKKGITSTMISKVLKAMDGQVPVGVYLMVGIPTQTAAEARASHERILSLLQQGLISDYTYSLFVLQPYAEMGDAPADYGITDMTAPTGADLNPDYNSFTCKEGMSRQEAFNLFTRFNRRLALIHQKNPSNKIWVNGKEVAMRFDLDRLRGIINSRWEVTCLPFKEFLALGDETEKPLQPIVP